jgi:hypothetical protein
MPDAQRLAINTDIATWRVTLSYLTEHEIAALLHAPLSPTRRLNVIFDHEQASRRTEARLQRWGYVR